MAVMAVDPAIVQSARKRIAWRILPFLFLLYIIAFLDRMNVGAARVADAGRSGLRRPSGGSRGRNVLHRIPGARNSGALIAERWSARRWIARIMISWGILTVLMAFIRTSRDFYVVRFLVGAAEAGFFPAVIVYISHWFRAADRAKSVASFYAASPLSYVIGSPLAGLLLGISWWGLRGWRWLFILEGIPAVVFGVVTLFYLTDWPRQAKWLPDDERNWISDVLDQEKRQSRRFVRTRFGKRSCSATSSC